MEFVDEHKDEADGAKQLTTSDASQSSSRHGLLSIKTLQPWHIPEYNMVGFTFQIFSQICTFVCLVLQECRRIACAGLLRFSSHLDLGGDLHLSSIIFLLWHCSHLNTVVKWVHIKHASVHIGRSTHWRIQRRFVVIYATSYGSQRQWKSGWISRNC